MSVSSSALSTSSSPSSWRLNDRLISLMDSIYAIIAGLGLRFVVDTVSRHDFKITGSLVGLWEGVILLHFLKKLPKSTDPYLAFAVRLFIDFVITESVLRLVLVLIWTGMGMILADVAPAIWEEIGLRRVWRRFRRDLYVMSESIPTVVFFPPTRTVRFSPSREPSVIAEEEEPEGEPYADAHSGPRSVASSTSAEQDTSANIDPTSIRRRLPGYFPGILSDTESVLSSVIGRSVHLPSTLQRDSERTSRRLSVYPMNTEDFASETSSQRNEVDDDIKLSSPSSSSQSTVTGEPADTTRFTDDIRITEDFDTTQLTDIPDEEGLEEQKPAVTIKTVEEAVKKDQPLEVEITPKQPTVPILLPPTPSDSQAPHKRRLPKAGHARPLSASIPLIPDMPEDVPSDSPVDGWEKIQKEDVNDAEAPWEQVQKEDAVEADKPPPPPPKDWPEMNPPLFTTSTNTNDHAGFDETTTVEHRRSQPPPYDFLDDHDDIYEDHPSNMKPLGAGDSSTPGFADPSVLGDRQVDEAAIEKQREEEENEKKRLEQEAAEKTRLEEEAAERKRKEEEVAEQKRLEEVAAAERRRVEEEAEQRKLKEAAEQKRSEEEAVAKRRREEEEEKKRQEEEAEKRRKEEEEEKKRQEEAEKRRREEEEAAEQKRRDEAAAEKRRQEEQKRLLEEAEKKRREEEAATERRKQEEAEQKRLKEEAETRRRQEAEQKKLKEEAEKKRGEEEAAAAEQKRKEEEATAERRKQEEAEQKRLEEEAAQRRRREEAEQKRLEEERLELAEQSRKAAAEKRRLEAEVEEKRLEEAEKKRLEHEAEQRLKEEEAEEEERNKQEKEAEQKRLEAAEKKTFEHEAEQQLKEEEKKQMENGTQLADTAPIPSTSVPAETQSYEQHGLETVKAEAHVKELGSDEEEGEEQRQMETESVATVQSTVPTDVEERLGRILLTKGQIMEVRFRIDELESQLEGTEEADKGALENELQRAKKDLEKMKKKEQRRGENVVPLQIDPGLNDGDNHICFDALNQDDTKTRLLEKLEELLSPDATSLHLTLEYGTKSLAKRQRQTVTEVITTFDLLRYSIIGKQTVIHIPDELFSEWVTEYRSSVTQLDDMAV